MKRVWAALLLAGALVFAMPVMAGQRDFDRGFFLGVEAFFAEARDANTDFAINETNGGETISAEFDNEASFRGWIGYAFRNSSLSFSYWNYNDDANEEESNLLPSGIRSTIRRDLGDFGWAEGVADVDAEVYDLTWAHRIGHKKLGVTPKFQAYWLAGLRYFKYDETLDSWFAPTAAGPFETVAADSQSTGFGVLTGLAGQYQFSKHFGFDGELKIAMLTGDTDTYVAAPSLGFERNDNTNKTFTQIEAALGFIWTVAGGFDIGFGYRYIDWQDVLTIPTKGGSSDNVTFLGPYVNVGGRFGVKLVDSDGDTVFDPDDKCPNTPVGCTVDETGCEKDTDNDGVCDGRDKCCCTPFGCKVDANGCQTDGDGDTVCDGLDACPGTPFGCRVDGKGCPVDTDGDTVCDGVDACPGTPARTRVDEQGCPMLPGDSDGDTVPDDKDRCPNTPRGVVVDEYGCERVLVLDNVLFDFNKAVIKAEFHDLLEKVAEEIKSDPQLRLELRGHTDSIGSEEYNMKLGLARANAVREFLEKKGVPADRLTSMSFGETQPVAPNTNPDGSDNPEGRAKNRRTEFQRSR